MTEEQTKTTDEDVVDGLDKEKISMLFSKLQELIGEGLDKLESWLEEQAQWPQELTIMVLKAKTEEELRLVFRTYNRYLRSLETDLYTPAPVVMFSTAQTPGIEVGLMWEILQPSRSNEKKRRLAARLSIDPIPDEEKTVEKAEAEGDKPAKSKFRDLRDDYRISTNAYLFDDYRVARDFANSLNAGVTYAKVHPVWEKFRKELFNVLAPTILERFEEDAVRVADSMRRVGENAPLSELLSGVRECILDPEGTAERAAARMDQKIAEATTPEEREQLIRVKQLHDEKKAKAKKLSSFVLGMQELLDEHRSKQTEKASVDPDEDEDDDSDENEGDIGDKRVEEPVASQD